MGLEDKAEGEWAAFKFVKPVKLEATGFPDGKSRYFPCAGCEKVKVIQGYVAKGRGALEDIQVMEKASGRFLAYYCKPCFRKYESGMDKDQKDL